MGFPQLQVAALGCPKAMQAGAATRVLTEKQQTENPLEARSLTRGVDHPATAPGTEKSFHKRTGS